MYVVFHLCTGRLRVELQGGIEVDRGREGRSPGQCHPAHRGRRHHRGGTAADREIRRSHRALRSYGLRHGACIRTAIGDVVLVFMYVCMYCIYKS